MCVYSSLSRDNLEHIHSDPYSIIQIGNSTISWHQIQIIDIISQRNYISASLLSLLLNSDCFLPFLTSIDLKGHLKLGEQRRRKLLSFISVVSVE